MPPSLTKRFTMKFYLDTENDVTIDATGRGNTRRAGRVFPGTLIGDGLEAELMPFSGEWLTINEATGTIYPDVRAQFRTTTRKDETSYAVYVQYRGIAQIDAKMLLILSGSREAQSTEFGDHEWFVWPVVETNHPGFKWVERAAFVGEGRWVVEGDGKVAVEVEVYQVGPSEGSDAGR